jgi:hypothetical protein
MMCPWCNAVCPLCDAVCPLSDAVYPWGVHGVMQCVRGFVHYREMQCVRGVTPCTRGVSTVWYSVSTVWCSVSKVTRCIHRVTWCACMLWLEGYKFVFKKYQVNAFKLLRKIICLLFILNGPILGHLDIHCGFFLFVCLFFFPAFPPLFVYVYLFIG